MRTDDLLDLLARHVEPVPRDAVRRRFARALATGLPISFLLMLVFFGLRDDWSEVLGEPMFWIKLAVPVAVALAAWRGVLRLGRPGVRLGGLGVAMLAPVAALVVLALVQWFGTSAEARPEALFGGSWRQCSLSIGLIASPVFVGALLVMRGLAPTRPALAGAVAGWMAGGAGAAVYALHCPEFAAPFLAVWYVLGMGLPALAGALVGRRVLVW